MKALVEVKGLKVRRSRRIALEIDSLEVHPGEVLALVGPNGAGKSTVLLVLARLIEPEQGQVIFNHQPLSHWDPLEYRRQLSFVFQDPLLLDMSVAENIALGLKFRGTPAAEVQSRVDRWLKLLGIESLRERRAVQLSGGEARRVSLARAFVLDPQLLLLDEPFTALDPPTRLKLLEDLSGLLAQEHRTAIFVTHNLKEAARLGQRVAVLVDGKIRQIGPVRQIKAAPADAEVAAFLHEYQAD